MNVAESLLEVLAAAGVRRIYGIPGDALNPIVDAVRRNDDIEFVHVRHEESGTFAANAEAKLTGQPVAVAGTAGPGALHLVNGLYDAKLDNAPVIAITGQIETDKLGIGYHQAVDVEAVFEPATLFNETVVDPAQMPRLAVQAVQEAIVGRGPVHLSVPINVSNMDVPDEARSPAFGDESFTVPNDEALDAAAELLNGSNKVVMFVGAGARRALDEVTQVAELLGAPIVKTLRGADVVPDDHPHLVGKLGLLGARSAVKAVNEADTMLWVGTDFPYEEFLPADKSGVQLDLNPANIGKRYPMDVGLVGHANLGLAALATRLQRKDDRSFLEDAQGWTETWQRFLSLAAESDQTPILPQRLAAEISGAATDDAIFTVDTGAVTVWAARHVAMNGRRRITWSSSLASMAYAMPGAIGAKLAHPNRQVIALAGDGGYSMLMGDLLTAITLDLDLTVVVFNNSKLGLIMMEQEVQGFPEYKTGLENPDFGEVARAMGAAGARVEKPGDLAGAIGEALAHPGPFVLDVVVDGEELTIPPTITPSQAWGFTKAKAKEFFGGGDDADGFAALWEAVPKR